MRTRLRLAPSRRDSELALVADELPLEGVRIIELAGVGPVPFCGMMLADAGAEVIRIDRAGGLGAGVPIDGERDVLLRSRRTISLDLKNDAARDIVRQLAATADGLIEGFRPGVMERLGLGPVELKEANPRLVYGRMTGWGQFGPYATLPGHDINYIALGGALDAIGAPGGAPIPPLNLVGDYAGGGLMLAFGMIAAILNMRTTQRGRVVDCAMSEGASSLLAGIWSLKHNGMWAGGRGTNLLDGGAPFYATYATSDGKSVAIGAIEERFFRRLCSLLGHEHDRDFENQHDRANWPMIRAKLETSFLAQPLAYFEQLFDGEDVCFTPIVTIDDAPGHHHNVARKAFVEVDGLVQPAPVPRYEGCVPATPYMWRENRDRDALLDELGFGADDIERLSQGGAFGATRPDQAAPS